MKCTLRTPVEILSARAQLNELVTRPALSDQQKILFMGMSVALQWVSQDGGETMVRLLSGEPVAEGQLREVPNFEGLGK